MRRIKVMLLSMAMLLGVSGAAYAGDFQGFPTVDLKVNGKAVYSDVPGILMSGRTMVPLRVISES